MAKFNFKRAVVAVGGNAVERDGDIFSSAAIEDAARIIRPLSEGRKLAIVHGNGPQFGFLSERYERMELYDKTAADVIKDSQDAIGSLLQWKLLEVDSSSIRPIAVDNTYVVIDPTDSSFENPVKGVGAWRYGSDFFEANNMSYMPHPIEDGCFREVVSSPKPLEVVDIDSIQQAVDSGLIIICGGGGGIPVFKNQGFDFDFQRKNCSRYHYYTIAKDRMVIDKDATAALIADGINADILIIFTNVPGFIDGYGTSNARIVREMSSNEAFERIYDNDNGEGSMNPKLAAAASFVGARPERKAIITSLVESGRLATGDLSEATLIKPSKEVAA